MAAAPALAQSATGSIAGRAAAGSEVTITNPDTGFSRSVTADADGNYRFSFVPVGNYNVQAAGSEQVPIEVTLGNATNVDVGAGATNLSAVQVVGSRVVTPRDGSSNGARSDERRAGHECVRKGEG